MGKYAVRLNMMPKNWSGRERECRKDSGMDTQARIPVFRGPNKTLEQSQSISGPARKKWVTT